MSVAARMPLAVALALDMQAAMAAVPSISGKAVFEKWCAPCHAPGPGHPGTIALAALYNGAKPAALAERTDLTPEIVKHYVRTGVSVMPFFRKTEVSDVELAALGDYLSHGASRP